MPFSAKTIRVCRRLLLTLASLATLLALATAIENWRGNRAWEHFIRAKADAGDSLSLFPPTAPIPDTNNFFKAPLLDGLFINDPANPKRTAFLERVKVPPYVGRSHAPLENVLKALRETPGASPLTSDPTENPARAILSLLSTFDQPLAELRQETELRPVSQYTLTEPPTFKNAISDLEFAFTLTRAIGVHARASLEDGHYDQACGEIVVLLRLGEGFARAPYTLLQSLTGVAIIGQALPTIKEGAIRGLWTPRQLSQFQEILARQDPLTGFAHALLVERNVNLTLSLDSPENREVFDDEKQENIPLFRNRGWWRQNLIRYSEHLDRLRAVVVKRGTPHFQERVGSFRAKSKATSSSSSRYLFLARLAAENLTEVTAGAIHDSEAITLAATACALERHRLAHGAYPETLAQLVPAYLPAVPLDVINGAPLRYTLNPDATFTLYSLGLDGDDDHGKRAADSSDPTPDGDWRW